MSNEHDWLSKCVKEIDVTDLDIDITDDFFDIDK